MKPEYTLVIEFVNGNPLNTGCLFSNFQDARNHYVLCLKANITDLLEGDINYYVDEGHYADNNGYEIYIMQPKRILRGVAE